MFITRGAPAIRWGDNLENTLAFALPLVDVLTYRPPRLGYEKAQAQDGSAEDAWVPGRGEYQMDGGLQYIDLADRTSPYAQVGWSGPTGVQAFLTWARDKRRFRFCPDVRALDFWVDRCYLVNPIADEPPVEDDGSRRVPLTLRSPHMDFGLAVRGLGFEYNTVVDPTDPPQIQLTRNQVAAYHNIAGQVAYSTINEVRNRHYDAGRRVMLREQSVRNDILQSEDLATTWGAGAVTVSANATASPEVGAPVTADRLVETAVTSVHEVVQNLTVIAGEYVFFAAYVKTAERFRGAIYWRNSGGSGDYLEITFNLSTGTIGTTVSNPGGGGVLSFARIVPLTNGWSRIEGVGRFNSTETTGNFTLRILDDAGSVSYLGDITKGIYYWGAQVGRSFAAAIPVPVMSYLKTTTAAAALNTDTENVDWPWPLQPMWGYYRFVELGEVFRANFGNAIWIGEQVGAIPQIRLITGAGTPGTTQKWRFNWSANGGGAQSAAIAVATPAVGDDVELFFRLLANGNVELTQAINGVEAVKVTSSGAAALSASVAITRRLAIMGATVGLRSLKLGFATSMTALSVARDV